MSLAQCWATWEGEDYNMRDIKNKIIMILLKNLSKYASQVTNHVFALRKFYVSQVTNHVFAPRKFYVYLRLINSNTCQNLIRLQNLIKMCRTADLIFLILYFLAPHLIISS